MAALSGATLLNQRFIVKAPSKSIKNPSLNRQWGQLSAVRLGSSRMGTGRVVLVAAAAPDSLSEKVAQSVKEATEVCSDDPVSGECVAAWDEVEELSAAASHARDKQKATTPIDEFCKNNPEDEECRTYED
ncbi:calvin cycle protein CP12-1, chloroplastic-like [Impatiens glandulifera]|uniref:calvin cycle protein CP12-1, chloroplastic-like n=1 Tax=Impatiens glandulifera TaxID=253017 RepID=UPI001FB153D4|nr:calvin cycle protein CP12-1, chloroplastic-like [Impatiens glandulifera]